ncbi:MAG: tetratricopeptide repeat protein, partial [bacterium]|nr:tetratricopeptide repeat protein [bacterium]
RRATGSEYSAFGTVVNNLALVYHDLGDLAAAERLYLESLDIKSKTVGKKTPGYAATLNNLADLYLERVDLEAAYAQWQLVLGICHETLGRQHRYTGITQQHLGSVRLHQGRMKEARHQLTESREILRESLGEEHPDYAKSLGSQAQLFLDLNQPDKVEEFTRSALAIAAGKLEDQHPWVKDTRLTLVRALTEQGKLEEAGEILDTLRQLQEQSSSERHRERRAGVLVAFANWCEKSGNREQARDVWAEALTLLADESMSWRRFSLRTEALLRLGRIEEARNSAEILIAKGWKRQSFIRLCKEHGLDL